MELTLLDKQLIWLEFKAFENDMYLGKSKEERNDLQQFFTPADLTIQMLEALDITKKEFLKTNILDPTSGSGNLLSAAAILGVPGGQLFGNEYDPEMVIACRERIKNIPNRILKAVANNNICESINNILNCQIDSEAIKKASNSLKNKLTTFNAEVQIHRGNALQKRCLIDFSKEYNDNYNTDYIDILEYAQSFNHEEEYEVCGKKQVFSCSALDWAEENEIGRTKKLEQEQLKQKKEELEKIKQENKENNDTVNLFEGTY